MSVTVVIPFAGRCPHRERALHCIVARYNREHPDWRVVVARGDSPWSKGAAVATALERTHSQIAIVADADVWTDGLTSAVRAVLCRAAQWAIPHRKVFRLTEAATTAYIRSGEIEEAVQSPYPGLPGGGIVVGLRDVFLTTPLDPRFVGWGQEDESWGAALATLHGKPWRGDADLIHLWHPPQQRMTRRRGSRASWDLFCRYHRARRDPESMRALLAEFNAPQEVAA